MGYAAYEVNGRDCGYAIDATCDHPGCDAEIHRGLDYLCGETPGGDEYGCGGYFCADHQWYVDHADRTVQACSTCGGKTAVLIVCGCEARRVVVRVDGATEWRHVDGWLIGDPCETGPRFVSVTDLDDVTDTGDCDGPLVDLPATVEA